MIKNSRHIQKNNLLKLLAGYKKVNKLTLAGKKQKLRSLTSKQAFLEYTALCEMWDLQINKDRLERLVKQRINFLVKRRVLLDKISEMMRVSIN